MKARFFAKNRVFTKPGNLQTRDFFAKNRVLLKNTVFFFAKTGNLQTPYFGKNRVFSS